MPELKDQLRAWADQAAPVTVEEARERATDIPLRPLGPSRSPQRRWLAVAAAVVAVGAVGAGVVALSGEDKDSVRPAGTTGTTEVPDTPDTVPGTTPAPPTTAAPEATTTVVTTPVTPPAGGALAVGEVIAQTADFKLVVWDTITGTAVRELATFDDPNATPPEGEPAGMGLYLDGVIVDHDRGYVYYGTCCEPAVGQMFKVPIKGGEPEVLGYGTYPALSPDGSKLAYVGPDALVVIDVESGEELHRATTGPATGSVGGGPAREIAYSLRDLAWTPDGEGLVLVAVDSSTGLGEIRHVRPDDGNDAIFAAQVLDRGQTGSDLRFPHIDAGGTATWFVQPAPEQGEAQVATFSSIPLADAGSDPTREQIGNGVRSRSFNDEGAELIVYTDGSTYLGGEPVGGSLTPGIRAAAH